MREDQSLRIEGGTECCGKYCDVSEKFDVYFGTLHGEPIHNLDSSSYIIRVITLGRLSQKCSIHGKICSVENRWKILIYMKGYY